MPSVPHVHTSVLRSQPLITHDGAPLVDPGQGNMHETDARGGPRGIHVTGTTSSVLLFLRGKRTGQVALNFQVHVWVAQICHKVFMRNSYEIPECSASRGFLHTLTFHVACPRRGYSPYLFFSFFRMELNQSASLSWRALFHISRGLSNVALS